MYRNVILMTSLALLLPIITACGSTSTPTNTVTILPKDCRMMTGEQMPLALDGLIPPNASISWDANGGGIISAPPGLNALFIATS